MENKEKVKIWVGEVPGYRLLDSGNKQKLEEIIGENGTKIRIVRAEPRAWWKPELPEEEWQKVKRGAKESFETVIDLGAGELKAKIKYKNSSKHIGIFPEQISQWNWIKNKIENSLDGAHRNEHRGEINILNLFGYTGIASLVAAKAGLSREGSPKWGAKVTHVDASKATIDWARENQKISMLEDAPIRWILDDAVKFINKEIARSNRYDAIIMDPPSYGKGPKGEIWKIEEKTCFYENIVLMLN